MTTILIAVMVLLGVTVEAQSSLSQIQFEHITVNDGLSHSDATAIVQDQEGFIWIGTNKGICRYDGQHLKIYDLPYQEHISVTNNRIRALFVDRSGKIWVGTENNGLYYYAAQIDCFRPITDIIAAKAPIPQLAALQSSSVITIASDTTGTIWAGCSNDGLYRISLDASGNITSVGLVRLPGVTGSRFGIFGLTLDKRQRLWFGTAHGVFFLNARQNELRATRASFIPSVLIQRIYIDPQQNMWVATSSKIYFVGKHPYGHGTATPVAMLADYEGVESIYMDSGNRLWIGSRKSGLIMFPAKDNPGSALPVEERLALRFAPVGQNPENVLSSRITQIYEDRWQALWLTTLAGGVHKVKSNKKQFGLLRPQLSGEILRSAGYINAIFKDENTQTLWLGTWQGVLSYNSKNNRYEKYRISAGARDLSNVQISSIFKDSRSTLWFGSEIGLFRLALQNTEKKIDIVPMPPASKTGSGINDVIEDRYGQIWVASSTLGVCLFDSKGTFIKSFGTHNKLLPITKANCFDYDRENDIMWTATAEGLFQLRVTPGNVALLRHFKHEPTNIKSLKVNYVCALSRGRNGDLWIGSIGGGLHKLYQDHAGKTILERAESWFVEKDVESLLEDSNGILWIGGRGLYRVDAVTRTYIHYDVTDGLQSNAFKVNAAWRSGDGTLYFGGTDGITFFKPYQIRRNPTPPVPQMIGLRVLNRQVGPGDTINRRVLVSQPFSKYQTIRLHASENEFAIDFIGVGFENASKNTYAYRLSGYNNNWIILSGTQPSASFANLPSGTYEFELKAANGDGVWSEVRKVIGVQVTPPLYRSIWAYLAYAAVIIMILLVYRRIAANQLSLRNRVALEQLKYEQEKEMSELKLNFFTNVSHELRTPLTLILAPAQELLTTLRNTGGPTEKVLLIQKQTQKLLALVNQLLEFRKVEAGKVAIHYIQADVVGFLNEIFVLFSIRAQQQQLEYHISMPDHPIPLYFDGQKLEIIIVNLLSNALKFTSHPGFVDVSVTEQVADQAFSEGALKISISDSGIGMSPEQLEKIFDPYYQAARSDTMQINGTGIGLSLVKEYVQALHGKVVVNSQMGKGTTFDVYLPAGSAHLPAGVSIEPLPIHQTAPTSEQTVLPPDPVSLAKPAWLASRRLLIVEDDVQIRNYLSSLFGSYMQIITAENGEKGVQVATENEPDIIISDVMMPAIDGIELCRRLRQNPGTCHIPIILLSARSAVIDEIEGLETGADDYIGKPFNPEILLTRTFALLHGQVRLREYYQKQLLLKPALISIPDADRTFLEKAMQIVERNLGESTFNVSVLQREIGMSQPVFYRRIKAATGKSGLEFIRDIRLKRAAQILASSDMRISEVAAAVGFEDVKYFRTLFQETYGVTPSEYSKNAKIK